MTRQAGGGSEEEYLRLEDKKKRPREARGRRFNFDLDFRLGSYSVWHLLVIGPISQLDVLFNFSALVTMFMRFVWPITGLAEWILSCPDQVADNIQ